MEKFIYDESNGLWYERQGTITSPACLCRRTTSPLGYGGSGTYGTSRSTARDSIPASC